MNNDIKLKFGIRVDNRGDGIWCFGIGLSHFSKETYLYINLYRWCISIGYMYEFEDEYEEF